MNFKLMIFNSLLMWLVSHLIDDKRKNSRVTKFIQSNEFQKTWTDATMAIGNAIEQIEEAEEA